MYKLKGEIGKVVGGCEFICIVEKEFFCEMDYVIVNWFLLIGLMVIYSRCYSWMNWVGFVGFVYNYCVYMRLYRVFYNYELWGCVLELGKLCLYLWKFEGVIGYILKNCFIFFLI